MGIGFDDLKCRFVLPLAVSVLAGCQSTENTSLTLQQANLKKALYCMEILENRPDLEPSHRIEILREECFAETYVQHSPYVEDGRDAVLKVFARRYKNAPELTTSIKRSVAVDDLVWLHQHVKRTPDDRGSAVVNIFRMKEGKFTEHWNVVQKVPETSKNNNTMF